MTLKANGSLNGLLDHLDRTRREAPALAERCATARRIDAEQELRDDIELPPETHVLLHKLPKTQRPEARRSFYDEFILSLRRGELREDAERFALAAMRMEVASWLRDKPFTRFHDAHITYVLDYLHDEENAYLARLERQGYLN